MELGNKFYNWMEDPEIKIDSDAQMLNGIRKLEQILLEKGFVHIVEIHENGDNLKFINETVAEEWSGYSVVSVTKLFFKNELDAVAVKLRCA